jgi:hypothetical protein
MPMLDPGVNDEGSAQLNHEEDFADFVDPLALLLPDPP